MLPIFTSIKDNIKLNFLPSIIIFSSLILFIFSSVRHALFQSNAWDLGIFDQAIYLISQGETPIPSLLGFHILGDHAAIIFYPLALFYKIYPDVHWLLAIQAIALCVASLPLWFLARQAGLTVAMSKTIVIVYLLYPLIFNLNLFDFHPEVIALPSFFWAVLAAKNNRLLQFITAIVLIISCKAVLSLTVVLMGFWLLVIEKKRLAGAIAIILGWAWLIISTQLIIPFFGDNAAEVGRHLFRYSHLGTSFSDIVKNLFTQPWLLIQALFNLPNLEYIFFLLLPLFWGLSPEKLSPLIVTIPALAMNLLSNIATQKNLTQQYSLPILPFLLLVVISTVAVEKTWIKKPKFMILWTLISFLALAKFGYFGSIYLESLDTLSATKQAIALIKTEEPVLTTSPIAPHLSQRKLIKLATKDIVSSDLNQYKYILLNLQHPGWASSPQIVNKLTKKLQKNKQFDLKFQKDNVILFLRLDSPVSHPYLTSVRYKMIDEEREEGISTIVRLRSPTTLNNPQCFHSRFKIAFYNRF